MRRIRSLLVLFVSLITLTPIAVESQTTDTLPAVEVEAPIGDLSMGQEVLTRLDSLVAHTTRGVEAGAEFTWPILVRQQIIGGVGSATLLAIGYILLVWLWRQREAEWAQFGSNNEIGPQWVLPLIGVLSGVLVGSILFFVDGGLTRILNPQYHALMDVLRAVGL